MQEYKTSITLKKAGTAGLATALGGLIEAWAVGSLPPLIALPQGSITTIVVALIYAGKNLFKNLKK